VVPIPRHPSEEAQAILREARQAVEPCEEVGERPAVSVTLLARPAEAIRTEGVADELWADNAQANAVVARGPEILG
jgi:hypothetical protein